MNAMVSVRASVSVVRRMFWGDRGLDRGVLGGMGREVEVGWLGGVSVLLDRVLLGRMFLVFLERLCLVCGSGCGMVCCSFCIICIVCFSCSSSGFKISDWICWAWRKCLSAASWSPVSYSKYATL